MTNASPSGQPRQIALLIDGDNVGASSEVVYCILRFLKKMGQVDIRKIYGDWSKPTLKNWHNVALEHRLYQEHFGSIPGKNSTDIAMVIGAMDILYQENVDAICLVTSDSDFTALAMRIRHGGKGVIGIGRRNTHASFVTSCNRFLYLEDLLPEASKSAVIQADMPAPVAPPVVPAISPAPQNTFIGQEKQNAAKFYALAEKAMTFIDAPNGWVNLGAFGHWIRHVKPDFNPADYYQTTKLRTLLEAHPQLFEVKPGDSDVMIRLIGKKVVSIPTATRSQNEKVAELYALSKKAMNLTSAPTGWVKIEEFASRLHQIKPNFNCREYSERSKFSDLVREYPNLFDIKKQGTVDMIKLR